jgi:hypothetical protein
MVIVEAEDVLASLAPCARATSDCARGKPLWGHLDERTRAVVLCCVRREASSGCAAGPRSRCIAQNHTKKETSQELFVSVWSVVVGEEQGLLCKR